MFMQLRLLGGLNVPSASSAEAVAPPNRYALSEPKLLQEQKRSPRESAVVPCSPGLLAQSSA